MSDATTDTKPGKVNEGDRFFYLGGAGHEPQAYYVSEVHVWKDGYREITLDTLEHVNASGNYVFPDTDAYCCGELEERDFEPGGSSHPNGEAPKGLKKVTRSFDKKGEFQGLAGGGAAFKKSPTHATHPEGGPLCGAKLSHKHTKAEGRWNPWDKQRCPEETTETAWVPSYAPVTCKKCLKALEKAE